MDSIFDSKSFHLRLVRIRPFPLFFCLTLFFILRVIVKKNCYTAPNYRFSVPLLLVQTGRGDITSVGLLRTPWCPFRLHLI